MTVLSRLQKSESFREIVESTIDYLSKSEGFSCFRHMQEEKYKTAYADLPFLFKLCRKACEEIESRVVEAEFIGFVRK